MKVTMPGRTKGCYKRGDIINSRVLYNFFRYKQLKILFPTPGGRATCAEDALAQEMLQHQLISGETYEAYLKQLRDAFPSVQALTQFDSMYIHEFYAFVQDIRKQMLGAAAIDEMHGIRAQRQCVFDPSGGIDQRAVKDALISRTEGVLLALFDTSLFSVFLDDLEKIPHDRIWVLISQEQGKDLPSRALMERLLKGKRKVRYLEAAEDLVLPVDNSCLLAYGEDGLLHCRNLQVDSIISAVPTGYCAQALVNQLGLEQACVVYVPRGMDITEYVPLVDRSRLTYWQLYRLWKNHGEEIYQQEPENLRLQYPQCFLNIYDSRPDAKDLQEAFPIRLPPGTDADKVKERVVKEYLNRFPGLTYGSLYRDGILVHHAKFQNPVGARIISCGGNVREAMAKEPTGVASNFLFFLTEKLGKLYNDLRADRPYEQTTEYYGHLDYMLCRKTGKETFPLFDKKCIAQDKDGLIAFFRFRLGGGKITVADIGIHWTAESVDSAVPGPVQVFTPYYSVPDEDDPARTYCKAVGHGRLNIVILQDKICCIRKGDVLLPSIGVVISLEQSHPLARRLSPLEDGYYNCANLPLTISLDPPAGFTQQRWEEIQWAYGGGMTLISDGESICDNDQIQEHLRTEGWLSPLSWQTQESALYTMDKHPRTALGLTEDGSFVMLVFSGRSRYSEGADYRDMVRCARHLYPNIRQLVNVDGGSSSCMGLVTHGSFLELNVPSPSAFSATGMVRPIYTMLHIPLK